MSVRIKLNNRKFLGEGLLIGSRLNEEGEVQQQAQAQPAAQQTTPQQQVQQQTAQPQQQTQAQATTQPQAQNQTQTPQNQEQKQQTIDQQIQGVLVKHFGALQQAIANDLKGIHGVQWANLIQPKDQTLNSVIVALQEYVKANIEAAKKSVEQQQQNNQSASQDSSTAAPAQ